MLSRHYTILQVEVDIFLSQLCQGHAFLALVVFVYFLSKFSNLHPTVMAT